VILQLGKTMRDKLGICAKRMLDFVLSGVALLLLLVPFGVIWLAVWSMSSGPGFFRQDRIGQEERPFRIWKFRTMIVEAESRGLGLNVSQDDERITPVGRVLRNWGLDELPQLINVLLGQMSLVGPRPTLAYQVEHYDVSQRRRLEMKPGITSLAVVSGRNALSWRERIELDVWYIDHWSLWLDIKILLRTLWVVLVRREGLYGEGGINDPFVEDTSVDKREG
jgi:undecaprenyl phosphate N,N'-diacetylbacillosamine 1-phosphate transferase